MLHDLVGNHPSLSLLLRLAMGIIFVAHGYPKLFKKDQGPKSVAGFLKSIGIPAPLFFAFVVGITEFFGGLLLIAGLVTQLAAILIAINLLVAIAKVKGKSGLVTRTMDGGWIGGYEFDVALLAMALVLLGAGTFSSDYIVFGAS